MNNINKINNLNDPNHIAIILDGNGTWAKLHGHTRNYGHRKGCENLVRIAKYARKRKIDYVTVFAFSTENWSRPKKEVDYLMDLAVTYLEKYLPELKKNNVKLKVLGTRKGLSISQIELIEKCENETKDCTGNHLNIAFNYGAHEEIIQACKSISLDICNGKIKQEEINDKLFSKYLYTNDSPPVDLLIRTSNQKRISNFLLWQIAYSELYFTDTLWPDFSEEDFENAIENYHTRTRKFGGIK